MRFGYNKYMTAATTGFAQIYNPTALTTASLSWTDTNGDDIAQGERGCIYLTPGCEINFGQLASNFGVRALSVFDANLKRPYQSAFNLGASHELLPGTSVTVEWFHSDFKNLIAEQRSRSASDYTPVTVASRSTAADRGLQRERGEGERRCRTWTAQIRT